MDRERRKHNLVIYGMPESSDSASAELGKMIILVSVMLFTHNSTLKTLISLKPFKLVDRPTADRDLY